MPHFVIDCSHNITKLVSPSKIMEAVHQKAVSSDLFDEKNIKVRINSFENYLTYNTQDNFIHVFANIMEGRNTNQKSQLSESIIEALNHLLPQVPVISINIRDFVTLFIFAMIWAFA